MRRVLLAAALAATLATAAPVAAEEVRSFSRSFDATALQQLYLDFPIGELEIEGTRSEKLMVEVTIECSRRRSLDACIDRAEDIELASRERDDRIDLWVEGYSKWRSRGMHLEMRVLVPAMMDVDVEMSIGELDIADVLGSVSVDMSIGEVKLAGSEEMVGRVSLDTGIGESSLSTNRGRNSSAGVFTREIAWTEGNGEAAIKIELGIGEISVRLR